MRKHCHNCGDSVRPTRCPCTRLSRSRLRQCAKPVQQAFLSHREKSNPSSIQAPEENLQAPRTQCLADRYTTRENDRLGTQRKSHTIGNSLTAEITKWRRFLKATSQTPFNRCQAHRAGMSPSGCTARTYRRDDVLPLPADGYRCYAGCHNREAHCELLSNYSVTAWLDLKIKLMPSLVKLPSYCSDFEGADSAPIGKQKLQHSLTSKTRRAYVVPDLRLSQNPSWPIASLLIVTPYRSNSNSPSPST